MLRAWLTLLLSIVFISSSGWAGTAVASEDSSHATRAGLPTIVTNIGQLRALSRDEFNRGRPISFTGIVTLVDNDRNRLALQDATGALTWHLAEPLDPSLFGKSIRLDCPEGHPYVTAFPIFPFSPSGATIERAFEGPSNWGDYHLTRMSGFLRPPQSGEYTFWIASDDSSELWLSADESPTRVRKIAFVAEGAWTYPHEWDRYPSQRSEPIHLQSDRIYYIEAYGEQAQQNDHLSVAWQGPGLSRSIVPGTHLAPWVNTAGTAVANGAEGVLTNGILREYWTNYALGSVMPIAPSGPAGAVMAGTEVTIQVLGAGELPEPQLIDLRQPMPANVDFRWIQTEGVIQFVGWEGTDATLELAAGPRRALVRVAHWDQKLQTGKNWRVQVQGVCEGVIDGNGEHTIGIIWVPGMEYVRVLEAAEDDETSFVESPDLPSTDSADTFGGYYLARGAVTFDGRFGGRRYLYIQDIHGSVCVSDVDRVFDKQLEIGQRIQVGGKLSPGKAGLKLVPITLRILGWESLPVPADTGTGAEFRDGQWTEVQGVVRSVGENGILNIDSEGRSLAVWSPAITKNDSLVDCLVRLRGVITLDAHEVPLLLVGSRQFVEIREQGPKDPFSLPLTRIRDLDAFPPQSSVIHRVKVAGTVTYANRDTAYLQDDSGAVRLQLPRDVRFQTGERLEVAGFPEANNAIRTLVDLSLRHRGMGRVQPVELDLSEAVARTNLGRLIRIRGNLLGQRTQGTVQILEMQSRHRAFEAALAPDHPPLPRFAPGSQLELVGVAAVNRTLAEDAEPVDPENLSLASLQVLLRSPADVILRHGPPWWTPIKVVALIGFLLAVLGGTLLWVRLLGRTYERRQRAQLAFSKRILESQEWERRRIAANLHDSLGQNLLVIKNQVRLAMHSALDRDGLSKRLDEISAMTSQAIEEVRQITHDLRPYQLERVGLTQTLRGTIRRVSENSSIAFASRVDDVDGLFNGEGEIHVYRILQEALNNVVKHSGATEATAIVRKDDDTVSIIVRDNGRGMENNGANGNDLSRAGFGLRGIDERARILRGKVLVDSHAGQGFRLTVEIPVVRPT